MKEYKVIALKDTLIGEGLNSQKIEDTINEYARQGWKFVSMSNFSNISSFKIVRDEVLLVFSKNAD